MFITLNGIEYPIDGELAKQLKERTGASFFECKRTIVDCRGDLDEATHIVNLRYQIMCLEQACRQYRIICGLSSAP